MVVALFALFQSIFREVQCAEGYYLHKVLITTFFFLQQDVAGISWLNPFIRRSHTIFILHVCHSSKSIANEPRQTSPL